MYIPFSLTVIYIAFISKQTLTYLLLFQNIKRVLISFAGKKSMTEPLQWEETLRLRDKTHFDTTHIEVLFEQYKSLCSKKGGGISKDIFLSCLGPLSTKKNLVVEQLFAFYDADGDGEISFPDFVNGMSVLSKGTKAERMKYIFRGLLSH